MGLRCIVQMLTIIHLMKVTNGSPVTMMPKTGLLVTTTEGCEGEDKLLLAEDHSTTENILTYEWVYSTRNVFSGTTNIILCQKTSGGFEVNPSYYGKVEYCDTSGIQLKNISMNDSGYYKLHFLREIMEHKESQTIFLTVSATPTEQCKPVIINHSGNVLNCTTRCGYLDLQWIWKKTESVVGSQSDLPISCSWKNEVILCCPKGQAMGCYKGKYDLCTPTKPSSCIENMPGDGGSDIHAVKAPDKSDSNLLGLLTLVIIPVLLVILWIFYWNKIKSWITMCHNRKNKSTLSCHMNTQEEVLNLLKRKEEPDSTSTVEVVEEPESTLTVEVIEESNSIPTVELVVEPESTLTVEVMEDPESTLTVEVMEEPESTPTVEVMEEPESTPTVEVMEEPESTPTVEVMEEPESTSTVEVKGEPESTPTVEVMEEPESTPTVEVMEEPESTSTVEVKGEPEVTSTVEVKEKSDSTSTQLFNETVPMLKEKEAADCNPTKLSDETVPMLKEKEAADCNPTKSLGEIVLMLKEKEAADCKPTQLSELETKEETTEHELNTDSETMRELQELRRASLCKICFANKINMLYLPCSHLATCANCSASLQQCPVCRTLITGKMIILLE